MYKELITCIQLIFIIIAKWIWYSKKTKKGYWIGHRTLVQISFSNSKYFHADDTDDYIL